MFKRLFLTSLVLVSILSAMVLSGCSEPVPTKSESEETIKIGLILPMKGELEVYGVLSKRAIDLAVDEINAQGGLLGMQVETIDGDDASNPSVSSYIANEYTQIRRVSAIVGPFATQSALTAAPVANRDGVPLITIRSSEANITAIGKYIFRASYVDSYQGTMLGEFAGRELKAKKAAVIFNSEDQDAQALVDAFKKALTEHGGKVETVQSYASDVTDFSEQLEEVAKVQPDVILLNDYDDKSGLIMKQAAEMNITAKYLGTDFWNAFSLVKEAGAAAEGSYYTAHFSADDPNPKVKDFVELYEGDYVAKPEFSSALSYDAMHLLFEAIKRADSTRPEKIATALAGIKNFEGVTGKFTFDENRNPVKGSVIMTIKDGKPVFAKRMEP
ncbi:MAG: ABC transporter substrate-binding protein [Actinomycetota bacterium]|nr:ABC transporter substrate-binding protein [Actinomycetota bacterium]